MKSRWVISSGGGFWGTGHGRGYFAGFTKYTKCRLLIRHLTACSALGICMPDKAIRS